MGRKKRADIGTDKKEHPLWRLYPLAGLLIRLFRRFVPERSSGGRLRVYGQLYTGEDARRRKELSECRQVSLVIMIIFLSLALFVLYLAADSEGGDVRRLRRPESGHENTGLLALTGQGSFKLDMKVSGVRKRGAELEKLFAASRGWLEKAILADNQDFQHITTSLNLIEKIPGTDITVSYEKFDTQYISLDGSIKNRGISEPVATSIEICMKYFDEARSHALRLVLQPPQPDGRAEFYEALSEELKRLDMQNPYDSELELPESFEGSRIVWRTREDTAPAILICGFLLALLSPLLFREERRRLMKKRKAQMMNDYAPIINKFMLLLSAGMTIRGAWDRICRDYLSDRKEKRFAYEEMLLSRNEMQLGRSDYRAIEDFGRRCGLPAYQKFCSIVTQNLKHGSRGILPLLEQEAAEAFAMKKEDARRQGEEAGTKLLLPMMIMLVIVMAIVIVPAFMSFSA